MTPQQIFEALLHRKKLYMEISTEDAEKLYNHLSVIKSRSKQLYEDLQLDFNNFVIRYKKPEDKVGYIFFGIDKLEVKKNYVVYEIKENEELSVAINPTTNQD